MKKFIIVVAVMATVIVNAENLIKNGSFETIGSCPAYDLLVERGFTLNFKNAEWAKSWQINPATKKANISLVSGEDAPDGEKYLQIKKGADVHIYPNITLPGDSKYSVSIYAKATAANNSINIYTYVYKKGKQLKYITAKLIKKIELTDKWQKFSVTIPVYGDDKVSRIALGVRGDCDLDNLIVNKEK